MRDWQRLYEFWFGAPGSPEARLTARLPLWFLKDPEADATARREFAPWLEDFESGALDAWRVTARGSLSLVLLLDQIPRNAFRGRPESFRYDSKALAVSLDSVERQWDRELTVLERIFLYLPIEHSESPTMQLLSVQKFTELHEETPPELASFTLQVVDYAVKHKEVIDRFGRYPHRNEILGRASTPEERQFLQEPGSSF